MELRAEGGELDAAEVGRVGVETAQGAGEQRDGSGAVAALEVVEGGCDLDERLEEVLLGLREGEPDGFPVLMGKEKLACAVAGEAFGERTAGPIKESGVECRGIARRGVGMRGARGHGMIIGDGGERCWNGKL